MKMTMAAAMSAPPHELITTRSGIASWRPETAVGIPAAFWFLSHNTGSAMGVAVYRMSQAKKDKWWWLNLSEWMNVAVPSSVVNGMTASHPTATWCQQPT